MITFPRLMPSHGSNAQMFEPQEIGYLSPEQGGRLGSVRSGFPIWTMALDLSAMLTEQSDIWRAWVTAQRGPGRRFYAFEIDRQIPLFHQDGTPFTKTPTAWSQTIDSDSTAYLTLDGLLPGMWISRGDYVGFRWDGWKRSLVRALEPVRVTETRSATFAIEPPVHTVTPVGATATLDRPDCLMRLEPSSTKLGRQILGGSTAGGGAIAAVQDLVA